MRLGDLKPGDRVEANVKGRVFEAPVLELRKGEAIVEPPPGFTYRHLTARQIRRRVV